MNPKEEKRAWREVKYSQKFLNAFRGIFIAFKSTRHFFIHILAALVVLLLGFYFKVSSVEWVLLVFAIGFVLTAEVFNTAVEIDIDLTSPEYHPYAKDTKDVAAAAVLLSVFSSVVAGLIIFLPKILAIFLK